MEKTTERLFQAARDLKQLSTAAQIARALNTSSQTIKNWQTRGISKQGIIDAQRALGVSADWLETGRGPMAVFGSDAETLAVSVREREPVLPGYVRFKLLDVTAAAGDGRFNTDYPETMQVFDVSEQWARRHLGPRIEDIALITAYGDSMLPTFADGDLLFVDTSVKEWREEGVYIFSTPSGLKVKRLHVMMNGSLKIISDNKEHYETEIVSGSDLENISICGKIKAAWTLHIV